jgi:hypothetical protein
MDFLLKLLSGALLFPILYAEIHYRFKYFFSLLHKKEPEIIADIPSRCHHGNNLPLLITIKDAHHFPVTLQKIVLFNRDLFISVYEIDKEINHSFFDLIIEIPTDTLTPGLNYLNFEITYSISGKVKKCRNDNYRFTSHDALPVYISAHPLPRLPECMYGETHTHTNFTSDQVEFGASLKATARMAEALELDFFCATDHSYDLDDLPHDYLKNDSNLGKWKSQQLEINQLNKIPENVFIIHGEEVTLRNSKGKNIHCLIYNSNTFCPGSGDSGERWFRTKSELTIEELLAKVEDDRIPIFAAHPAEKPPFLQRLLIGRDRWQVQDFTHPRLNGLQFINGGSPESLKAGKKLWISLLLRGYKLIGLAGNDAHGSFGRSRQIRMPFISMHEDYCHLFGKWRTGVYIDTKENKQEKCLQNLRLGNCFMTNGPALQFRSQGIPMGSTVDRIESLSIEVLSTPEFGSIAYIQIFCGQKNSSQEKILYTKHFSETILQYSETVKTTQNNTSYVRCEMYTIEGYQALSNPIWIDQQNTEVRSSEVQNS